MKFYQQFEIDKLSYMFVPNFEAMSHVISILRPENHVKKLGLKAVLMKNDLNTAKIFHRVIIRLKIPFYPYQRTFGHDEFFFSCFFFLFFLNLVCSSPKPQHIDI